MASEIKVDTISEKTSANGVTIDSLSIKDGGLIAEGNIDVNGNNLVLDANANTYLDAGTDDTIKFYVAGAHDLTISANAINVLSGTTLTIDSGATIANSGTATGFSSADPASADGDTLGTASAEWSDLYLADGSVIYFGNDQEIKLTHVADTGLALKHTATADDKPVVLTLQTGETDIAADDVIGAINFQAPDEGTGTDAILVAAGIEAVSEGDFSSSSNATKLSFKTGSSEAAAEKMALSSGGLLRLGGSTSPQAAADNLVIQGAADTGMSIFSGADGKAAVYLGQDGANNDCKFEYDNDTNALVIHTNAAERMRIHSNGDIVFGANFGTFSSATVGTGCAAGGYIFATRDGSGTFVFNRLSDDGDMGYFQQAGNTEGSISISGSTTSYNAFCGSHWSRLANNSKPTILRGTVMESIATMMDWYQAAADVEEVLYVAEDQEVIDGDKNVGDVKETAYQVKENIALPDGKSVGDAVTFTSNGTEYTGVYVKEDNEQLPMCKVSDTSESKAVYGVFMTWDDNDDGLDGDVNDMYVSALGAFVVRIHKDETVAIGDYLQSKGDGTAKVQADDIMRASTIAKVTSTEKTHIHADDSYCVPCTLHCG
jgi:hypothetical protein